MASATMKDVAERAGVSIKTVSNVVNDFPYVRPETRSRVRAAIEELGYQVNPSARSLRSGRTGMIGLALPELTLSYFAELADLTLQAALRRGLTVVIEQTQGTREGELAVLRGPLRRATDGLIFSPLGVGPDDADVLRVDYPLVLLGERIFDGPVDHVTMENVGAARLATEHLISLGCRRIAAIGEHPGETMGSAVLRMRGYAEALAAHGIEFDDSLVGVASVWHHLNGATAMTRILDGGVVPDGVFAFNDALAIGAMRVLHERRLRVPQDVAVVGFDDLDQAAYALPALTSIDPGREEIAERAVELLVDRIATGGLAGAAPTTHRAAFRLVERTSTARG